MKRLTAEVPNKNIFISIVPEGRKSGKVKPLEIKILYTSECR
jgi:hypothetical protein